MSSALYNLEGDFGFSLANASAPAPEVGHEVKLLNFADGWGQPAALSLQRFAYNKTFEEAFPDGIRGFNRPTNVRFGPDGCAYVADYGAVRDFGRSDPDTAIKNRADAALVQIPPPASSGRYARIERRGAIWARWRRSPTPSRPDARPALTYPSDLCYYNNIFDF